MKITKTSKLLLGTVILVSATSSAQTVNTGELSITPGTEVGILEEFDNSITGDFVNDGELYLFDHYNNDGLVSFSKDKNFGTTFMVGKKGYQDISGSVPMEWNNAVFNNAVIQPAFRLSNEIRISGKATFQTGIVDSDNNGGSMVFEQNATHDKTSDLSHVDGIVRKNGNTEFVFPIGDGGFYRYARISSPQKMESAYSGHYFFKDSDFLYPHASKEEIIKLIDNSEYWTLERTAGTDTVFLTLSWSSDTTNSEIYDLPYDEIHIVRWDEVQSKWIDLGGATNSSAKEVSMVVNPLESYGVFTLARVSKVLGDLIIYNAVSANEDGSNDYFKIGGIENYKKNNVEIYNRWGVKVFETSGYDNTTNVFRGFSEGRATVKKGEKLPVGTYFYIIHATDTASGKNSEKSGYLYLSY